MKKYRIVCVENDQINWALLPCAEISEYTWSKEYTPKAYAQLAYIPGEKFVLRMFCQEKQPKAVYTEYNQPVYLDSCLEFFADWANAGKYVNMEMNSLGTLLSCIGAGRGQRTPIADLTGGEIFGVVSGKTQDGWFITADIKLDIICKLYGCTPDIFKKGYKFGGNFYKCGDETEVAHYGMWNPVGTEKPDFHRPEFFGELEIV